MPNEPYSFDLYRIFLGDQPPLFLVEVAFRTVVVFAYTLALLRWMGKRGMGNLSPFEFAIIVALGSAVGDPMFYDDVPLVPTMLVITVVIAMQRVLAWLTERNPPVERFFQSEARMLVKEGVICVDGLHQEGLSHEELCESLRTAGVRQLGEVAHAYLEPSGKLSVLRQRPARAGLSILPGDSRRVAGAGAFSCCGCCGLVTDAGGASDSRCRNCGGRSWTRAVEP